MQVTLEAITGPARNNQVSGGVGPPARQWNDMIQGRMLQRQDARAINAAASAVPERRVLQGPLVLSQVVGPPQQGPVTPVARRSPGLEPQEDTLGHDTSPNDDTPPRRGRSGVE